MENDMIRCPNRSSRTPSRGLRALPRVVSALALLGGLLGVLPLAAQSASVVLEPVISDLGAPLALTHAGDGQGRLFITEQSGQILVHDGQNLLSEPFLDVASEISTGNERGLLSAAFHPNYPVNGFFYVFYTDLGGDLTIARYQVSGADPNRADADSGQVLLSIPHQVFENHNGGQLQFGPDGFLYAGTGDGGGAGDSEGNGQNLGTLLGAILRLDVDNPGAGQNYGIPGDNPFLGDGDARDEIWAYGLRNPWRFSFDRDLGDLWIADVGQNEFEEINLQPDGSGGGENYGWNTMEGSSCFRGNNCNDTGLTLPTLEYDHSEGCSVTGGYRYRGAAIAELAGAYVFGDFCSGTIWAAFEEADGGFRRETLLETSLRITAFGEDEAGELYVVSFGSSQPNVHRLAPGGSVADLVSKPRRLNFRQIGVGERSRPERILLINRSDFTLTLGELSIEGADTDAFRQRGKDTCSGATLEPRDRCRLRLVFEPGETRAYRAWAVFPTSGGELQVRLLGRGR